MKLHFTFHGDPQSKDNSRTISRQGRIVTGNRASRQFEKDVAKDAFTQTLTVRHYLPTKKKIRVLRCAFFFARRVEVRDLLNYQKSLFDALQEVIYVDDNQIWEATGFSKQLDKKKPRIELELETIE